MTSFPLLVTAPRSGANIAGPIDGLSGGNCAVQRLGLTVNYCALQQQQWLGRIIITIYIDGLKYVENEDSSSATRAAATTSTTVLISGILFSSTNLQHAVRTALTF